MEILGSNFVSGDTLTYTDPQGDIYPSTASKLTFVSSGEIEYQLDDDSDPGTWTVKVNSADGTVHSSAASFSVASAVPPPGTPQQGIDVRNVSISNYAENITTAGDAFVGQYWISDNSRCQHSPVCWFEYCFYLRKIWNVGYGL